MLTGLASLFVLALPAPPRDFISCTPTTVDLPQGTVQAANPIAVALRHARAGTTLLLESGDYPPFTIGFDNNSKDNAKTAGGQEGFPVVIQGMGFVRIRSNGQGSTISVHQAVRNGWFTFRDFEIEPGFSSAIHFFKQPPNRVHRGFVFENVHIRGGFDHATGFGPQSKWGVWGHNLADFVYKGVGSPAVIENLRDEHAFYLQNPKGSILIENVHGRRLGRTFFQLTSRASEGPPGRGKVVVRDCVVEDACIGAGDGYKGGSAFTVAGRHEGTVLIEENRYRAGFDPALRRLTLDGAPYGTGAFVHFDAGEKPLTAAVVLRDNDFALAEGCGDRPVVSIGGCRSVRIEGRNRFVSGGGQPALALDPGVDAEGRLVSPPNGTVKVAPATEVVGDVTLRGEKVDRAALARRQKDGR